MSRRAPKSPRAALSNQTLSRLCGRSLGCQPDFGVIGPPDIYTSLFFSKHFLQTLLAPPPTASHTPEAGRAGTQVSDLASGAPSSPKLSCWKRPACRQDTCPCPAFPCSSLQMRGPCCHSAEPRFLLDPAQRVAVGSEACHHGGLTRPR